VRWSAQYKVAAKMPKAAAMRTTMIVSTGMDDSLRSGAMMLGAAVRGFDLDQIRTHPVSPLRRETQITSSSLQRTR
jgi:hypothetical protein